MGQALCALHDLDRVLQYAIEQVVMLLEAEGASVLLLDEARQELYFHVAEDTRPGVERRLREVRFPADQGIAGWVVREGVSALVPDLTQDPRHYRGVDAQTGTQTRALICVPLRTQDRIIGVLEAINKRQDAFSPADVSLLETLAPMLALAIENSRLIQALQGAQARLTAENRALREAIEPDVRFATLIGASPAMHEVYRLVARVLETSATVLLTGESGTGKELVARVLHYQGPRAQGPWIAVNCAALPETLLEAELFGYEPGAFTGATHRKLGRFELAAEGTLFLDEIAELSPLLQAKLLRVLQEKTFERLGGTKTLTTDARIIAATNRDLPRRIAEGTFRDDLFYRLSVYPIPLPALRERPEDILPLAAHFLEKHRCALRKEIQGLTPEACALLQRYAWPGNVRELENVLERAVILCPGGWVTVQELPLALREGSQVPTGTGQGFRLPPAGLSLAGLEKQLICEALEQTQQNKSRASRLLGLSRTQLRTRMKQYGLAAVASGNGVG
jgi:transcriptional regulator with GAF, ATPase, and Fis domain